MACHFWAIVVGSINGLKFLGIFLWKQTIKVQPFLSENCFVLPHGFFNFKCSMQLVSKSFPSDPFAISRQKQVLLPELSPGLHRRSSSFSSHPACEGKWPTIMRHCGQSSGKWRQKIGAPVELQPVHWLLSLPISEPLGKILKWMFCKIAVEYSLLTLDVSSNTFACG